MFLIILSVNVLLFLIYVGYFNKGRFYSCPHLDSKSCTAPRKIRVPGLKGEGVLLAYKTPSNTSLYSPVDGSMMVFAKPFFVVKEERKTVRLPGIIVYKLDNEGRPEYSIYFIVKHNIKRDRMVRPIKKGEKIADITGKIYKDYNILVGANRFDRKQKKFVVDESLLDEIFLTAK